MQERIDTMDGMDAPITNHPFVFAIAHSPISTLVCVE